MHGNMNVEPIRSIRERKPKAERESELIKLKRKRMRKEKHSLMFNVEKRNG